MNSPEDHPVSDLALHALHIIARCPSCTTLQRLHGTMPELRAGHLQPLIDRGWIASQPPPRHSKDKGSRYTITDAGTAHIRRLVQVSQSVPVIA
jgi:hypothetical protein